MSTAIAKVGGGFAIAPANMGELFRFAEMIAASDLVPKDYRGKPGNCMVAMQMGGELGLSPMQAIQNIAVINGRPSVWGDAMLALCQVQPDYVDTVETYDPATRTAMCVAKRKGRSDKIASFSWEEAVTAKLDQKDTYKQYGKRMLQMRARGFALRDQWTDVLKGLISAEEAQDMPKEVRAEVTSQRNVEEPKAEAPKAEPKPERKSQPPAAPATPRFMGNWANPTWKGMPISEAPPHVINAYIGDLEKVLADNSRKRLHANAAKAKAEAEAVYEQMVAAEMDRVKAASAAAEPDPVAVKLQQAIDAETDHKQDPERVMDMNDGWGLEAAGK